MAIDSIPAPVLWRSDSHQHAAVPMNPASSPQAKPAEDQGLVQARETALCATGSFTSRTSVCSVGSDSDSVLPPAPCFPDVWSHFASSSLRSWRSWQLPSSSSDPFWNRPSPDSLPDTPRLKALATEASGTSPYLLSMFATIPACQGDCRAAGDQMHCFLLWDTWLKQYGSEQEMKQFASFSAACGSRQGQDAGVVAESFPRRLTKKYPLKMESYLSSIETLFPSSQQASPWLAEYSALSQIYASSGLSLHRKMRELHKTKQVADPSEFLMYRGLTCGFLQLALLAARNHMQGRPSQAALQAIYPLLGLGSMLLAIFSDIHLASQGKHHKVTAVSSLEMFDDVWAASVQNGLLALFEEEADDLLKQDREQLSSKLESTSQVPELVNVTCAALHGAVLWYQTCPAWNALGSHAPLDDRTSSPSSVLTPLSFPRGHAPVPMSVAGTVDAAVRSFTMLLAKP